jgi:serine/threonine protein kinase/Tol biopolymer transport system component
MTPERLEQIARLYDAALASEAGEPRARVLREACAGDEELRLEVEALLDHAPAAQAFLEEPALDVAAQLVSATTSSESTHRTLVVGARLGAFEIIAPLGAGGMGEVFRARDTRLGREVAIKFLPEAFTADATRLTRFEREARTLAALNHPHIAAIYGVEETDGLRGIVLELVEGETLAERLHRGAVRLPEALAIARQVADALDVAHEKGIVHRDLKPANIKVTSAGVVKVLDFGLAKVKGHDQREVGADLLTVTVEGTKPGALLGTAAYMSPEQARGEEVDKRTDIWAFGCVLYEMLTGRSAFARDAIAETLAAILERALDWQALPSDTPEGIRRLLRRCLSKDRAQRLADIGDARLEIDDALARPHRDAYQVAVPARRDSRRATVVTLGVLSGLLAIALILSGRQLRSLARGPASGSHVYRTSLLLSYDVSLLPVVPSYRLALSPDGSRLAFVAAGPDGQLHVYVRSLDGYTEQRLQGTEDASSVFWSPDGRFVGYSQEGKLKKVPANGGSSVTLCDAEGQATGASWNGNDVILFTTVRGGPIKSVSASGGASTVVLAPDSTQGENGYWWPYFLPDGKHYIYFALGPGLRPLGIYLASLGATDRKLLVSGGSNAQFAQGHLLFLRDHALMAQRFNSDRLELVGDAAMVADDIAVGGNSGVTGAFSVSQTGLLAYHTEQRGSQTRLTWLDRNGTRLGTIGDEANYGDLQLSPDGIHASMSLPNPTLPARNIWLMDLLRGLPTRFTFDGADQWQSIWSPDGGRLVFNSENGRHLIVKASGETRAEQRLLSDDAPKIPVSWSADGNFILYARQAPKETGWDVWALPLAAGSKPFPVVQTPFDEGPADFSPDGQWIAYLSNEAGRQEVYVSPFSRQGVRVRVSTTGVAPGSGGAVSPRWRRNGEVFYLDASGLLTAVPVRTAGTSVEVGKAQGLFRLTPGQGTRNSWDVTADGQRILVSVGQQGPAAPISLVVNWPALLK